MPESDIQRLPEKDAIEQIVKTVQRAEKGTAPFALVLGSGFSQGLVPTARELVSESLPLWMKAVDDKKSFTDLQNEIPADQRAKIACDFWRGFVQLNANRKLDLPLDSQGLPESYSDAYRAVFTPRYTGAVGTPAEARNFQRALMRLDKPRLNAAHFLLASLLGVQPGKSRPNNLFNASAAFSRLILTTNFDPFLQTALQVVNRLYFMSDTPEIGVGDEIFDDQTDAMHLVYLHGTIHRRSQAATPESIKALKERNAKILAPVLKRHGVIVLGYSGWDDAIVEALTACEDFDHRLYWCGREPDPLAKGAFGPRVADILRKPSALYVQTAGAGRFMAQLCIRLVKGLPLLNNPIAQLREMLESIDLAELRNLVTAQPVASKTPHLMDIASDTEAFVQAQKLTLQRLREVEQVFSVETVPPVQEIAPTPTDRRDDKIATAPSVDTRRQIHQLLSSARVAAALGNYAETLKLCNDALNLAPLEPADLADLWLVQGRAHYFLGQHDEAISIWGEISDLPDVPLAQAVEALFSSGAVWAQNGDTEKAIAAFTRLIEHFPSAPVDQLAMALTYRGVFWKKGEMERALADYTRVIEQLPGASVEQVAIALRHRGILWEERRETEKALADYTRLIELPGAPVEQLATALGNRGVLWERKGEAEKALADFTRLIELPGAPVEQLARTLAARGYLWFRKGDAKKALADETRVIEELPGAPVEQVAMALMLRGLLWTLAGETEKALADYTRLIEQLPDAPVEHAAAALYHRGIILEQNGETEKALADYTRLIEQSPGAPVEKVAEALTYRGGIWARKGETKKALADYTRVTEELPGAPIEKVAEALYNRGLVWGEKGETEKALADETRVIEELPGAPVAQVAAALTSRACLWNQKGETEKALADYTRVIEQLPGAPVEEVANALTNRGWAKYVRNDFLAFLADTEVAANKLPSSNIAAFNLGLALLACGRDAEALQAYRRAGKQFPQSIETAGLADLEEAKKNWLSDERAQPVIELLQSLKE
jgi:tetratricopeptide (TPR) repeat protein